MFNKFGKKNYALTLDQYPEFWIYLFLNYGTNKEKWMYSFLKKQWKKRMYSFNYRTKEEKRMYLQELDVCFCPLFSA